MLDGYSYPPDSKTKTHSKENICIQTYSVTLYQVAHMFWDAQLLVYIFEKLDISTDVQLLLLYIFEYLL